VAAETYQLVSADIADEKRMRIRRTTPMPVMLK